MKRNTSTEDTAARTNQRILKACFESRSGESYGGGFENRSAADIWVREHRKRRKRYQMVPSEQNFQTRSNSVTP
ncbi:hypothetical protein GCM10010869_58940 [Mesorhizobium tianshanense]|nr:hypothetical protein GCM10010869_58940 [Mesorhizobium tianshanense]